MRRVLLLIASSATVLTACQNSSEQTLSTEPEQAIVNAEVGQTFELRTGQTANIGGGGGLIVGFRGVAQDSRCPVNVTCVWAGDATLRMQATIARMAWTPLDLHTNVEPNSARFRDHTITVVGLQPQPREGERIPASQYVVTLRVE